MSLLGKSLLAPHTLPWLLQSQRAIGQLRDRGDEPSRQLAAALDAALHDRWTPEEAVWVARIEAVRQRAMQSKTMIRMEDFGAGSPSAHLSAEQMYSGRIVEKTLGEFCHASKPYLWTSVLFHLVRAFKPRVILELGCCVGISASYQAAAQQLNGFGKLWTFEGASELAAVARQHLAELDLAQVTVVEGRFQDTLAPTIAVTAPIGCAFVDGHHDEDATLAYFAQLLPHLTPRALLIFDDIDWSAGMTRAWKRIAADPRVTISVETRTLGLCVIDPTVAKRHWRIPLA